MQIMQKVKKLLKINTIEIYYKHSKEF